MRLALAAPLPFYLLLCEYLIDGAGVGGSSRASQVVRCCFSASPLLVFSFRSACSMIFQTELESLFQQELYWSCWSPYKLSFWSLENERVEMWRGWCRGAGTRWQVLIWNHRNAYILLQFNHTHLLNTCCVPGLECRGEGEQR